MTTRTARRRGEPRGLYYSLLVANKKRLHEILCAHNGSIYGNPAFKIALLSIPVVEQMNNDDLNSEKEGSSKGTLLQSACCKQEKIE
jgi:hypothetical protein